MAEEARIVNGVSGEGKFVGNAPLTTQITREQSPELLLNEIDQRVTKIRPMSTPIDQISRYAGARKSKSMIVDYYSVDTKPTKATTTAEIVGGSKATEKLTIDTKNLFDVGDTIMVQGVRGYVNGQDTESSEDLVLYVQSVDDAGDPTVQAINGKGSGNFVPAIASGSKLIRMGRASTELDVQTAQFEALPTKAQNYCQIFKMQVEQSTYQRMADKEVQWNFSDQEEIAVADMRLAMEKSFLFGSKRVIRDSKKKSDVYLTGGIWWMAGKEYEYDTSLDWTVKDITDLMQATFTGNSGNKRKILIAGSNLINKLNKLDYQKMVNANDDFVKWGIDFNTLRSKYGRLEVLHDEVFDDCGMADYGFILDPEYLTKWSHVSFDRQTLDLKTAGIRNTDAVVLTEASCLTLRYPACHLRIVPKGE